MALFEAHYGKGNWIDKVDPRLKLVWLGLLLTSALINTTWPILLLVTVVTIASSLAAGIPARTLRIPLAALGVVALEMLVVQVLFGRLGHPIWHWGWITVYSDSVPVALTMSLRLAGLCLASMQFFAWNSPGDLVLMLVKVGIPYRFAMLAGLAMRFVPLMERELASIIESQKARGLPMDTAFQMLKGILPVVIPFLYRAFRRAGETALAMETRGFGRHKERTFTKDLHIKYWEVVTMGLMTVIIGWQLIDKI